jgi:hypothetical protein
MTKNPDPFIVAGLHAFNAGQWDEAFMQFQTYWLAARSHESKALAQYANALNQLRLGLVTAPRVMLGRALELTEDNPRATGVNIGRMRADILLLLEHWPADGSGLDPSRFNGRTLEWQS